MGLLACWQVPRAVQRRAAAVRVQPDGRRQAAGSDECARAARVSAVAVVPHTARPPGGRVIGRFVSRVCLLVPRCVWVKIL